MKTLKNVILPLLATLVLFSCKKQDLHQNIPAAQTTAPLAAGKEEAIQWATYAQWSEMKQEHFTINYTSVEDSSLSASIAEKGLVLVYKKDAATAASIQLPFEEKKDHTTQYWYYQVFEGQLLLSCDVYGSSPAAIQQSPFTYMALSEERLNSLAAKGYSREALMHLSYTDVKKAIAHL